MVLAGRARHWSNRWKGRDQQYGAAPGMQDWAAWSQLQHGQYEGQGFDVDAPNGHHSHAYGNGHVGSGSIGQAYADGAGYGYKDADGYALHNGQQYRQYDGQAYEGSTEDLYEQVGTHLSASWLQSISAGMVPSPMTGLHPLMAA